MNKLMRDALPAPCSEAAPGAQSAQDGFAPSSAATRDLGDPAGRGSRRPRATGALADGLPARPALTVLTALPPPASHLSQMPQRTGGSSMPAHLTGWVRAGLVIGPPATGRPLTVQIVSQVPAVAVLQKSSHTPSSAARPDPPALLRAPHHPTPKPWHSVPHSSLGQLSLTIHA